MEQKTFNDQNSVATSADIKQEIISGYNTTKITKVPAFSFILDNGIRVFVEKDYGMWQVSVYRNWNSPKDSGDQLLDRRAFNLTPDYKTIKWSDKVINKAVELIEKAIA